MNRMEMAQFAEELAELEKWEIYDFLEQLETELIEADGERVAEINELIWLTEKYLDEFDWRD